MAGGRGGAEAHISHLDSVLDVSQLQIGSKVFRRLGPPGSRDPYQLPLTLLVKINYSSN